METKKDYVVYTISLQGKVMYVGSTKDFERRKKEHLQQKDYSSIPTDIDPSTVTIEIVKVWKSEKAMLNSEGRLIKKYDTIKNGWNRVNSGLGIDTDNMKEYQAEWSRRYRYGNKEWLEHRKASAKKYRDTHKEQVREYYKRWYEKHNEYMKVYMRSYNKEKKKEYYRRWYEKHKKNKIAD